MKKTVTGLVVLAMLLLAAPAQAQAEDGVPTAAGTVTVSASAPAAVTLHVPDDATLDLDQVATSLEGGDGFTGVVLREAGESDGLEIAALRYPAILEFSRYTLTRGSTATADREEPTPLNTPSDSCQRCHLPPGDYELLVLADGAATTATLAFEGLDGATTLSAEELSPVSNRVINTDSFKGHQAELMNGAVSRGHCCFSGGTAFWQYATAMRTETLARATHEFCVRANGGDDPSCGLGNGSRQDFVGTAGPDNQANFGIFEVPVGSYKFQSRFTYTTATALDFEFDADVLWVAW